MKRKKAPESDPLKRVLDEIEDLIRSEHRTLEKFSYETGAVPKATLAKLMANRKDCRVSTLKKLCAGLNRKLVIQVRK